MKKMIPDVMSRFFSRNMDRYYFPPTDGVCAFQAISHAWSTLFQKKTPIDWNAWWEEYEVTWNTGLSMNRFLDVGGVSISVLGSMLKFSGMRARLWFCVPTTEGGANPISPRVATHRMDNTISLGVDEDEFGEAKYEIDLIVLPGGNVNKKHIILCLNKGRRDLDYYGRCVICSAWVIMWKHNGLTGNWGFSEHTKNCYLCGCGQRVQGDGNHGITCSQRAGTYRNQFMKIRPHLEPVMPINDSNLSEKYQWFADFECADFGKGYHEVYCAVLKSITESNHEVFIGKDALKDFCARILSPGKKPVKGFVWFHNGSGYDFNFILPEFLHSIPFLKNDECKILKRGNRILQIKLKTKPPLTLRDFYLFCPSSLAKLCKDFKVPDRIAKGDFDHKKIKTWEDVDRFQKEIRIYCVKDVLCLEYCYKSFSKTILAAGDTHMCKSPTLASHAFKLWSTITDPETVKLNYIPSPEVYKYLRECYYGGRVCPTVSGWALKDGQDQTFDPQVHTNEEDYSVDYGYASWVYRNDYYHLVDVVSLYPYVMWKCQMPVGQIKEHNFEELDESCQPDLLNMINNHSCTDWVGDEDEAMYLQAMEHHGESDNEILRSIYLVDVECPKDCYVAYLMERGLDGTNAQTLHNKTRQWYCGVDLAEAVTLGYRVTRVYRSVVWEGLENVFETYVNKIFKLKQESPKDSVMYSVAKLLLNGLSGKFGQKVEEESHLLIKEFSETIVTKYLQRITEFSFIEKDDQVVGSMINVTSEELKTKFPTQLSIFILAHARRHMSKMLRSVNGYRNPDTCFGYTDTDSMLINHTTFMALPQKFKGDNLGQLQDEFKGGAIIAFKILAPKTYTLTILQLNNSKNCYEIRVKTRCKGVPHRGDLFDPFSFEDIESIEEPDLTGSVDLGKRWYRVHTPEDDEAEEEYVPFLDCSSYDEVLKGKSLVTVYFGTLQKSYREEGTHQTFRIRPKWIHRGLCVENWWDKGKRIKRDKWGEMMTLCPGQIDPNDPEQTQVMEDSSDDTMEIENAE